MFSISIIFLTLKTDDTGAFLRLKTDDTDALLHLKTDDTDAFVHLINDNTEYPLRWKNDDTESFLCLIPNKNDDTDEKNRKGFRRFWLEKNDDTDGFLRFLTKIFQLGFHLPNDMIYPITLVALLT